MTLAVLLLLLVIWYLVHKFYQMQKDHEFAVERLKWSHLLREANLDERHFIFSGSSVSIEQRELPEGEQLHSIHHRKSGKFLLLKSGGRFFEYQDSVYDGPPVNGELGGLILPGTKCQKLVEVDRARALEGLDPKSV